MKIENTKKDEVQHLALSKDINVTLFDKKLPENLCDVTIRLLLSKNIFLL